MRSFGGCAATSDGLILAAATASGQDYVGPPFPRMRRFAKSPPIYPWAGESSPARLEHVLAAERRALRPKLMDAAIGTTSDHH